MAPGHGAEQKKIRSVKSKQTNPLQRQITGQIRGNGTNNHMEAVITVPETNELSEGRNLKDAHQ